MLTTEPPFSPRPPGHGGPDQRDGRPRVEAERLEELRLADGVEREWVMGSAQRADEQVDAAEGVDGPVGEHRHGGFAVHGADDADHVESLRSQGCFGGRDPTLVAAVDHHRGALSGQAESTGSADARIGGRAGHDRHPTGEPWDPATSARGAAVMLKRSVGSIAFILPDANGSRSPGAGERLRRPGQPMATIGASRTTSPVEPWKTASP